MIILDTDALTIIQRADGPEYERLAERLDLADFRKVPGLQVEDWMA